MERVLNASRVIHIQKVEETLQPPRFYLRFSFNWVESDSLLNRLLYYFNIVTCWTIFVLQHIFIYHNVHNIEYIIGAYSTLLTVILVAIKQMFLFSKRKLVIKLLHVIRHEFWPIQSFEEEFKEIWLIMVLLKYFVITYGVAAIIITQIWMLFPYVDTLPGFRKLPILCWFPYDVNKSPIHEITYAWIDFCGCFVMFGIIGFDMLFSFFTMHVIAQFHMLKAAFRSIKSNNNNSSSKNDDDTVYKEMIFFIEHHLKLIGFCDDLRNLYDVHNVFGIFGNGLACCVLFFLIGEEQDSTKQVKLVSFFCCVVAELAIYCFFGSVLQYVSETVGVAACESGWWMTSKRFKMGLIHVMQASKNPQKLSACGLADFNNETLVMVFRTAFSVSTLLRNMNSEG